MKTQTHSVHTNECKDDQRGMRPEHSQKNRLSSTEREREIMYYIVTRCGDLTLTSTKIYPFPLWTPICAPTISGKINMFRRCVLMIAGFFIGSPATARLAFLSLWMKDRGFCFNPLLNLRRARAVTNFNNSLCGKSNSFSTSIPLNTETNTKTQSQHVILWKFNYSSKSIGDALSQCLKQFQTETVWFLVMERTDNSTFWIYVSFSTLPIWRHRCGFPASAFSWSSSLAIHYNETLEGNQVWLKGVSLREYHGDWLRLDWLSGISKWTVLTDWWMRFETRCDGRVWRQWFDCTLSAVALLENLLLFFVIFWPSSKWYRECDHSQFIFDQTPQVMNSASNCSTKEPYISI